MPVKKSSMVLSSVAAALLVAGAANVLTDDPNLTPLVLQSGQSSVLKTLSGEAPSEDSALKEGQELAFDRKKGNCLACHSIAGGEAPGNIGPPLVAMKVRYPDRAKLYDKVWDATATNPETVMLPFGKYGILSKDELEKVVDFVWTL